MLISSQPYLIHRIFLASKHGSFVSVVHWKGIQIKSEVSVYSSKTRFITSSNSRRRFRLAWRRSCRSTLKNLIWRLLRGANDCRGSVDESFHLSVEWPHCIQGVWDPHIKHKFFLRGVPTRSFSSPSTSPCIHGMLNHCRTDPTPPIALNSSVSIYTPRGKCEHSEGSWRMCLVQGHSTMTPAKSSTWIAWSKIQGIYLATWTWTVRHFCQTSFNRRSIQGRVSTTYLHTQNRSESTTLPLNRTVDSLNRN